MGAGSTATDGDRMDALRLDLSDRPTIDLGEPMKRLLSIEPAVIVAFIGSLFPIAVLFGLDVPVGAEEATLVAIPLVIGAVTAALTRPIKVPAIVAGVEALLIALIAWRVDIAPDLVPLLSTALIALGGLLVRAQVIPSGGAVDTEVVATA